MLVNHLLALTALGLARLGLAESNVPKQSGDPRVPCGFKIAPCRYNTYCKPDSSKCTDVNKCPGTCTFRNTYSSCGGFRVNPPKCRPGYTCIDDSRIPGNCGMACDAPGICVPKNAPSCGGFTGRPCPKGKWCYDDPRDSCDPNKGGADCTGICL